MRLEVFAPRPEGLLLPARLPGALGERELRAPSLRSRGQRGGRGDDSSGRGGRHRALGHRVLPAGKPGVVVGRVGVVQCLARARQPRARGGAPGGHARGGHVSRSQTSRQRACDATLGTRLVRYHRDRGGVSVAHASGC